MAYDYAFRWEMGVNGESMDKRLQKATLVPEPTTVAAWELHVQFVSRYVSLNLQNSYKFKESHQNFTKI